MAPVNKERHPVAGQAVVDEPVNVGTPVHEANRNMVRDKESEQQDAQPVEFVPPCQERQPSPHKLPWAVPPVEFRGRCAQQSPPIRESLIPMSERVKDVTGGVGGKGYFQRQGRRSKGCARSTRKCPPAEFDLAKREGTSLTAASFHSWHLMQLTRLIGPWSRMIGRIKPSLKPAPLRYRMPCRRRA